MAQTGSDTKTTTFQRPDRDNLGVGQCSTYSSRLPTFRQTLMISQRVKNKGNEWIWTPTIHTDTFE